jgi:dihydroorotase (homodimeric type)
MQHNDTLQIIRPDDWHLHVRSGEMLKSVIGMTALQMGRAIIMPNLTPPVSDAVQAQQYHQEIMSALPEDSDFTPLMVLYLTDNTTPEQIQAAVDGGLVVAAKLYPAGATTNSDSGVTDITNIYPALEKMLSEFDASKVKIREKVMNKKQKVVIMEGIKDGNIYKNVISAILQVFKIDFADIKFEIEAEIIPAYAKVFLHSDCSDGCTTSIPTPEEIKRRSREILN